MSVHRTNPDKNQTFCLQNPVIAYFVRTFTISWIGALAVAANHVMHCTGSSLRRREGLGMVRNDLKGEVNFHGFHMLAQTQFRAPRHETISERDKNLSAR
jgi:hypothetical protein